MQRSKVYLRRLDIEHVYRQIGTRTTEYLTHMVFSAT